MKRFLVITLLAINLCLLYGYSGLHKEMSATRAEAAQLRQEAVKNSVKLVQAEAELDRLGEYAEAVYSQVKYLRMIVVEGER